MKNRSLLAIAVAAALMGLGSTRAHADTFYVFSLNDTGDATLRQAILDANSAAGRDTIIFPAGVTGTIRLSPTSGPMAITGDLKIQGPGPSALTISGEDRTRVFSIAGGTNVTIAGLTISNGVASEVERGGGIVNSGDLTLTGCTFSRNIAGHGGAIFNAGALTAIESTFSDNIAFGGAGIDNRGTLALYACTLARNSGQGGCGISNLGKATMTNSTLSENRGSAVSNGVEGTFTLIGCSLVRNAGVGIGNGGTLSISDSSLLENGPQAAIVNGGTLTATNCTVSRNSTGVENGGVLTMTACTLSANRSRYGAGLFNRRTATLTHCILSQNTATGLDINYPGLGGGIFNSDGTLSLVDCTLSNNSADLGGGIYNGLGDLKATRCTLAGNRAEDGGGIFAAIRATLTGCFLFANFAANRGGAAFASDGLDLRLVDCTVAGNGAILGGGIFVRTWLTVAGCTVNGNVASEGGGIFVGRSQVLDGGKPASAPGILTLRNSTLSGNRAYAGGGLVNWGELRMTNSTLFGNRADAGGAIRNLTAAVVKVGNTVVANSGAAGNCTSDGGVTITSLGCNLDSDGTCGLTDASDQAGTPAMPLDPKLGPLQQNGGPTATHALAPGSPAIDLGNNELAGGFAPLVTDQRGFARISDGNGDGASVIDIGAFELSFFGSQGFAVRAEEAFVAFSTVQGQNTDLPAGTTGFNLTIHYSADIAPETFVAMLNGKNITDLFSPSTPAGFETVAVPLRAGPNRLILRVKGIRDGKPAQDVDNLGFRVGEPPFGPR